MRRPAFTLLVMTLFTLAACGTQTPVEKARANSGHTLPEHLALTGVINGMLTSGLNAQGIVHAQPDPLPNSGSAMFLQTSCADYKLGDDANGGAGAETHEWEADIYGRVRSEQVTIRFSFEGPSAIVGDHELRGGTQDPEAVQVYVDTPAEHDLYYPIYPSKIHIGDDGHSGTVTATLGDGPTGRARERLSGGWRCA